MNSPRRRLAPGLWAASLLVILMGHAMLAPPFSSAADKPEEAATDEGALLREIPFRYDTAKYEDTTTASRFEQAVTRSPSSVSIVMADDIKRFGYRTLADILRSVRGFYTSHDRNYTYLGVRGFSRPGDYSTRVLILVDGHRINDNVYDTAPIGSEFPLDVDLIDRVEVVRGPSSSLYGSNAFFAVVNVITRRGRELKAMEASASAESRQTYAGRLTVGRRFENGFEGILSGSLFDSQGNRRLYFQEFDAPATHSGIAEKADGDGGAQLFTTLSYGDVRLQALHSSRSKHDPTAPYGADFNDRRYRTTDEYTYVDLGYERPFGADWEVGGRLYYDRYAFQGDVPIAGVLNRDIGKGERVGGETQVTVRAVQRNTIVGGLHVDWNFRQEQRNFDIDPALSYLDSRQHSTRWGVYLQDEISLFSNLVANAGVRYDDHEDFKGRVSPRVALIYTPLPGTAAKLLYGQAYRTPNAYERYYADTLTSKGNLALHPERISTYELVLEQRVTDWLRATVTPFYFDIRNLIEQAVDSNDGMLVFQNVGHAVSRGIEAELEGKWSTGWSARVAYSFQEARNKVTDMRLSDSPHHLVQAGITAPILRDRLFLGVEMQYVGDRLTRTGGTAGGRAIVNLTLFSSGLWIKGLDLSASLYNLLDIKYRNPVSDAHLQETVEQDGIGFRFKLTYSY